MTEQSEAELAAELERCREQLQVLQALETGHLQTHAALLEAKAYLDMIVDCAEDYAILSLDTDNKITMWSLGAERIFGWTQEEAIGKSGAIIFTHEQREQGAVEQEMALATAQGHAADERWHLKKDGTLFFASGMMRPMRDEQGTLRGFVKVARDVTQRKLADQERAELLEKSEAARQRAELAEAQRTRFMAMVVHELRTPLTSIKGFTSTLLSNDIEWTVGQQAEFIQIIDAEAEKLNEMVNQLLDLSQVESGTLRIQRMPTTARDIINSAGSQLQAVTQHHRVDVRIEEGIPEVMADPTRLAQVVVNLVNNAAKYAPAGSTIEIIFTEGGGFTDGASGLKGSVRDEGPGIPADRRDQVFEAFRQLGQGKGRSVGVGLGLAICKGIIEAHGGRIWIEQPEDRPGTTVSFVLPQEPGSQAIGD